VTARTNGNAGTFEGVAGSEMNEHSTFILHYSGTPCMHALCADARVPSASRPSIRPSGPAFPARPAGAQNPKLHHSPRKNPVSMQPAGRELFTPNGVNTHHKTFLTLFKHRFPTWGVNTPLIGCMLFSARRLPSAPEVTTLYKSVYDDDYYMYYYYCIIINY